MKAWTQSGLGLVVWRMHGFTHTSTWQILFFSVHDTESIKGKLIFLVEFIFWVETFCHFPCLSYHKESLCKLLRLMRDALSLMWQRLLSYNKTFSSHVHQVSTTSRRLKSISQRVRFLPSLSLEDLTGPSVYTLVQSGFIKTFTFIPSLNTWLGALLTHNHVWPCWHISIMTPTALAYKARVCSPMMFPLKTSLP